MNRLVWHGSFGLSSGAERRVGVSIVNLSVLKNGRARAVRFSTLTAICDVLFVQPPA
jgi:putative transcriptional regulator